MKEFGSDFHFITHKQNNLSSLAKYNQTYYANGRMALLDLIKMKGWKRIWMPEYFCYEIISAIRKTGIEILFYPDGPEKDDCSIIAKLPFVKGDVLFRMNYFGMRAYRSNISIPVNVIEDHSHGILSEWASLSDADYCIASLRKTLPLPEGGILWSPKKKTIPVSPPQSLNNDNLVYKRISAMLLKKIYLEDGIADKVFFRELYVQTENEFENLDICAMSQYCKILLSTIDVELFYELKFRNWNILVSGLNKQVEYLKPENSFDCPFSLVLKLIDEGKRNMIKRELIKRNVFPAILWQMPEGVYAKRNDIYLSIHCDGRYSVDDIILLAKLINKVCSYG